MKLAATERNVAQIDWIWRREGGRCVRKGEAAVGEDYLIVSQKIQQFQDLCHKNVTSSATEEFPTSCEDVAVFWVMVSV